MILRVVGHVQNLSTATGIKIECTEGKGYKSAISCKIKDTNQQKINMLNRFNINTANTNIRDKALCYPSLSHYLEESDKFMKTVKMCVIGIFITLSSNFSFAANKVVVIPMAGDSTDPATIQDIYDQIQSLKDQNLALKNRVTILENSQSIAVYAGGEQNIPTPDKKSIRSVSLKAPSDGIVIVNSTVNGYATKQDEGILCSISTSPTNLHGSYAQAWTTSGTGSTAHGQLGGTRGFDVTAGSTNDYFLVCTFSGSFASPPVVRDSSLSAIFIPKTR